MTGKTNAMQYMILIYDSEQAWSALPEAEIHRILGEFMRYTQEITDAGIVRANGRLAPVGSATTLRGNGGKVVTTDGPFAETKEQLGGFYLIEVANLDEALRWAERCPGVAIGSVEVRPMFEMPD